MKAIKILHSGWFIFPVDIIGMIIIFANFFTVKNGILAALGLLLVLVAFAVQQHKWNTA